MSTPEDAFELGQLCDAAGVTARTVRYYIQQGLLPSPGMGPGTRYGQGHLDRLRLIRRLQREHLPLAEIRKRLGRLEDVQVAQALLAATGEEGAAGSRSESTAERDSVTDYVAGVLREPRPTDRDIDMSQSMFVSPGDRDPGRKESSAAPYERDRWDRYRVADDVEIHVRRPLSRETNRRVERLLEAARKILGEEP